MLTSFSRSTLAVSFTTEDWEYGVGGGGAVVAADGVCDNDVVDELTSYAVVVAS